MFEFAFSELLQKGRAADTFLKAESNRSLDRLGDTVAGRVVDGRYFVNRGRGAPAMRDSMQVLKTGDFARRVISVARHAQWLDKGTRAHAIVARNAMFLRFFVNSGAPIFRKRVFHPGTKARDFSGKESSFVEAMLPDVLEVAARVAIDRAGLS